jgi:hypothetical protein
MTLMNTFGLDAPVVVLTMNFSKDALLQGQSKRSGALR